MKTIVLLLFVFLLGCAVDRTISEVSEAEISILGEFQNIDHKSKSFLTDNNEPGEKLLLCLTFIRKVDKKVLSGQQVKFYHTSTNGDYELLNPNDESSARLNGLAVTDHKGRIYVETILPGDYGSSADNRHIHTLVYGAKPEAYDIHFKQFTGVMGRNFIEGSDQHFLAELKRTTKGTLVCFLSIEVKTEQETP